MAPIQIVRLDKKSKGLELNLDALKDILLSDKCRDKPICVVSIAGDFRKGKSFMLNFFLRYLYHVSKHQHDQDWLGDADQKLDGFSWRGGNKPETTGILVWDDPIVIKKSDGQEVAVLLMDTQGAFDSRQTVGQTAIMFALSTLTSSVQIYNVMGNIQEDNLQYLDTFLAYGQLVLDESSEKPFQELCFLVRDWRSPKNHPFGAEGGASCLAEMLEMDEERPEESEFNMTRRRIQRCFERKSCFLMPFPGLKVHTDDDDEGQFGGELSAMDDRFVKYLKEFVPSILSPEKILIKRVAGQIVNGETLMEYFKAYAEIFSDDEKIPQSKTLYDATMEAGNLAAKVSALNHYTNAMKDMCGPDKPYINPSILEHKHNDLLKSSLEMFVATKKLAHSNSIYEELERDLKDTYQDFLKMNENKNMFKVWGSPLIMMVFWFLAFTLSKIFDLISLGFIANLFYLQSTLCFFSILFYIGLKYSGNFPEIVVAVDNVAKQCWEMGMDFVIAQMRQRAIAM